MSVLSVTVEHAREVVDRGWRNNCCLPWFRLGLRPAFPSDPFFEGTILGHFVIERSLSGGPLTAKEARALEEAILEASPRMKPTGLAWLACTRDASCCGLEATSEDARRGFKVIRKVAINRRTGRCFLTVWPEFAHCVDAIMENLPLVTVDDGRKRLSTNDVHLVEAVPVGADIDAYGAWRRVPMARVLCANDDPLEHTKTNAKKQQETTQSTGHRQRRRRPEQRSPLAESSTSSLNDDRPNHCDAITTTSEADEE